MASDQGTGTTIAFTGFPAADLLSVSGSGASRDAIETTHMGTTTAKTFVPADIEDAGEFSMEIAFLGSLTLPTLLGAAAQSVVITWAGAGAGNIWTFSAFCTSFDITSSINERMTANVTLKISGDIGIT